MTRIILLAAALLAALAPAALRAQAIEVEAEDFDACLDIGGLPIGTALDPDCSGFSMLEGLDTAGEWTRYLVSVAEPGIYQPRLVCRGSLGESYHFVLVVTGNVSGATDTTEFFYTGLGYG